jgi:hypothetical protein
MHAADRELKRKLVFPLDQERWRRELGGTQVRAETIPLVNHDLMPTTPMSAANAAGFVEPHLPAYLVDLIAEFVAKGAKRP